MKLYAKINDRDGNYERVVLCEFENEENDKMFIEEVERNGVEMFHVLLDEGYVRTNYYYPIDRYTITELEVYR